MKPLKICAGLLFIMLAISITACTKDEPGAWSSHDYYTATVKTDGSSAYYWVIDMDNRPGPGFDGSFVIQAWTLNGRRMPDMPAYSGTYSINGINIYIGWNHQSMNTIWQFTTNGIQMIGASNPPELSSLTFYDGPPLFK